MVRVHGLAKMSKGSWCYYEREVARGLESYYQAAGEEPGRWVGAGAVSLGLQGEVSAEGLARLFDDGCHPSTGEVLGRGFVHFGNRSTVTGYALSFSPPKSVSVLWALGGDHVHGQVRAAHDAAVAAAVAYLEGHACFARSGKAGMFQADAGGFVAASFVHRSSRARDPQLHTHVLVANKVLRSDGEWRALDARELYAMQKPAGMLYNAALRAELIERLGVRFDPVDTNGQADVAGVPQVLLEVFSARRRQVVAGGNARIAALEVTLGRSLSDGERAECFQQAALQDRPGKADHGETDQQQQARWQDDAQAVGTPAERWLGDVVHAAPDLQLPFDRHDEMVVDRVVVDRVVGELLEARSTFGRADIAKILAPWLPADVGFGADGARRWLDTMTAAVADHAEVITLACPVLAGAPGSLRRGDGLALADRHNERRYTTRTTLTREAAVLDAARQGRTARLAIAAPDTVDAAATRFGLGPDQQAALGRLCRSGEQVVCLVGPAGTGKTRTVAAAASAWTASQVRVRGMAVSAVAAGVLAADAGIPADTLARTLARLDDGHDPLQPGEVLLVDEAGMVPTADLARLTGHVTAAGAKLVLVGDDRQLPPIGLGGLFRLLVADTGAATLDQVRRFTEPWEQAASLRLRAGDPTVIAVYHDHGRVHGGHRDDMIDVAFQAWQQASDAGESVVALGADHVTVNGLAMRARAARIAAGQVQASGIIVGEQTIGVGDHVVTGRNDRTLRTTSGHWVRNGDRWHITATRPDGALTVSSLTGHGQLVLPAGYVGDHVRLAYALTVHKAQGITVDHAILVADERLTAELVYVALTRGRHTNHAYVTIEGHTGEHPAGPARTAVDVLAAAIQRPGVEPAATQVLRDQLARSEDLAVLYPLWEQARANIDRLAGPDLTDQIVGLRIRTSRQPHVEHHRNNLHQQLAAVTAAADQARQLADTARHEADQLVGRPRWRRPSHATLHAAQTEAETAGRRLAALVHEQRTLETSLGSAKKHVEDLQAAAEQLTPLEEAQAARARWLADSPREVEWENELRQAIRHRTLDLGETAAVDQPDHLTRILGQPGHRITHQQWVAAAGRIEGYRERWHIAPDALAERPATKAQDAHWRQIQLALPETVRAAHQQVERGLELGL